MASSRSGISALVLLVGALVTTIISLASGDGFDRIRSMKESLAAQKAKNEEVREYVGHLRREVRGLQTDDRALEKAARNELGMSREDEMIVIFEKQGEPAS